MVTLPEPILKGRERPFTLDNILFNAKNDTLMEALPSGYRRVMGYNLPPWQRDLVWTDDQCQQFIESIFLGLGTGTYVVTDLEHDQDGNVLKTSCLLLDGQQRLTAIERFINNEFGVFDGIHYGDLTVVQQRLRFRHTTFPCVEISALTPEPVLKEMYYRLNHGGTAHTDADFESLTHNL